MNEYPTLDEAALRRLLADLQKIPVELQTTVAAHSTQLAGLDRRVDEHDNALAVLAARTTQAESSIGGLTGRMSAAEGAITALDTRVITNEGSITSLNTRVTTNEGDITSLNTRVTTNEGDITSLKNRVGTLEGVFVSNEAELLAAIATSRKVWLKTLITLSAKLNLTVPYTELESAAPGAGLLFPHTSVEARSVVRLAAKGIKLKGLVITTNHPLVTDTGIHDIGVEFATDGTDISGCCIEGCTIHNVMHCFLRFGGASVARDIQIKWNTLRSFGQYGILMTSLAKGVQITKNKIFGRWDGETHPQVGNGIWFGNYGDYAQIDGNEIAFCGRIGIEYWNSQDSPTNTGGNLNGFICDNSVHDMLNTPQSFGISVFGNGVTKVHRNRIADCTIGLETYGDKVNKSVIHCTDNTISRWGHTASVAHGISVNGVRGGLYTGNVVEAPIDNAAHSNTQGMIVVNGGSNLRIVNNWFYDAGVTNILVTGKGMTITGITQAADAVFTVSATIDINDNNGWNVGKRIHLDGIGGMTGLNNKYYTITWVSGNQFRVGVNTSAMSAYTSGGIVRERWDGLSIEGNHFRRTLVPGDPGNSAYKAAIWLYEIQAAVVAGNRSFVSPSLGLANFSLSNYGTVYIGPTSAEVVSLTTGTQTLAGTNIEITTPLES